MIDMALHRITPPVLVLAWGNLSRGDDALGPLCLAALQNTLSQGLRDQIEFLEDYQLQVEHVLDLMGRASVLFIDASLDCQAPFEVTSLVARRDTSYTSHALSPQALLQAFVDVQGDTPPPATLLAIRGEVFELGAPLSPGAQHNLCAALVWATDRIAAHATVSSVYAVRPASDTTTPAAHPGLAGACAAQRRQPQTPD